MTHLFARQLADGPGAPIVLSHALGLDHQMWTSTAAQFAGEHPVLAYDHRGHGRSPVTPGPYSMAQLVDDAREVIESWGRGPVIWVGLSMGGMVGQGLAIGRPDLVRALVLAHTTARYPAAARDAWQQRIRLVTQGGMPAVVDLVLQRYLTPAVREAQPQLEEQLRRRVLTTDAAGYAASCAAVASVDWLDDLNRIACPTLVLAGELDAGAPPAMAREMHERIRGARLAILPDASHLSPLEQPARFDAALRSFIAGC